VPEGSHFRSGASWLGAEAMWVYRSRIPFAMRPLLLLLLFATLLDGAGSRRPRKGITTPPRAIAEGRIAKHKQAAKSPRALRLRGERAVPQERVGAAAEPSVGPSGDGAHRDVSRLDEDIRRAQTAEEVLSLACPLNRTGGLALVLRPAQVVAAVDRIGVLANRPGGASAVNNTVLLYHVPFSQQRAALLAAVARAAPELSGRDLAKMLQGLSRAQAAGFREERALSALASGAL